MGRIILIPGLLCDAFAWQGILAHLPVDTYIADNTRQTTITAMAETCLEETKGALRVAGHSMGARVVLEMVRLEPNRIEKMALLDTGIHGLKEGEREKRQAIIDYAHEYGMQALAQRWLPPMVYEGNHNNKELMDGLHAMVLRMTPEIHERQINALVNRPDAKTHLPNITCPTLLMVGRQDLWSPISQHEDMQNCIKGSVLEIIEDAGHFAPCEQPQHTAASLVPFLTK
ncbi:MAG: alpha/beta fold hydrolase [Candidatus Puniceispirillaceae bacterium]